MKQKMTSTYLIFMVLAFAVNDLCCVNCKTIQLNSTQKRSVIGKHRKLDNFVEFTDEGDQLAVESIGTGTSVEDMEGDILRKPTSVSATGRQCPNVQKAVYPVIPVIIAFKIAFIGAIIIAGIVKLIHRSKNDSSDSSEHGGYDRRVGNRNTGILGLDYKNFSGLLKTVLSAIDKVF